MRVFKKDVAKVKDKLMVLGGKLLGTKKGDYKMEDGSPVPVGIIMENFGVSREEAEKIAARYQ